MIYFDNAATTFPKPESVYRVAVNSMRCYGGNPGRSGHKMSVKSGERLYRCRELVADFLGLNNPANVIFTLNATHALNIIINGFLKPGDHVVCTGMEHNSVLRPLRARIGDITVSCARADESGYVSAENIMECIRPDTALVIVTHVSNVCGTIQPIDEISIMLQKLGIPLMVDASQSAGILNIDMEKQGIAFLAAPGHKGLYGPMGTGILCINGNYDIRPLYFGGTGSNSKSLEQPDEMPDRFESGTVNFPGICALEEGIRCIMNIGTENILNHELYLTALLLDAIEDLPGYSVVGKKTTLGRTGVVSICCHDRGCSETSQLLSDNYGIATRAMYHCAYKAHEALGTAESGTLRVSFGMFNTAKEVQKFIYALGHI